MYSVLTLVLSIAMVSSLISSAMLTSVKPVAAFTTSSTTITNTKTPIKHLVILFQENVSFDHYFGTYPFATNPPGEPRFMPAHNTPSINGLTGALLNDNPNGNYSINPFRLDRSQAVTCDMNHGYTAEQQAYHGGLVDKFVEFTGPTQEGCTDIHHKRLVMGYFDGNTVTALWNYAQHFAINDNSFGTVFGPSTLGALNLISGTTVGGLPRNQFNDDGTPGIVNGTVVSDLDPKMDDCSGKGVRIQMTGKNIGDVLNAKGITWGWFQGGFKPTKITAEGRAFCGAWHKNINGIVATDYIPHHAAFMFYNSTTNPHHIPPTSVAMIGHTDQANHQYDLSDFWAAAQAGNMPAVSFLKAAGYQDGHPGLAHSDPLDEQNYLVSTLNHLQRLPEWNITAVIITWDDSDGWYDHVMPPIVSQSSDSRSDRLLGVHGLCGTAPTGLAQDRCGYGPRIPLLIISPYAKTNFVDHTLIDQTSILRFIEYNWGLGRIGNQSFDVKAGPIDNMFNFIMYKPENPILLDPTTGMPINIK
jgi:phospholipase C